MVAVAVPWVHLAGVALEVISLALIPVVLIRRKEPSSTLAWILALIFLPAVGALLFLAFGRDRVRWSARRKREMDALVRAEVATHAPQIIAGAGDSIPVPQVTDLEIALFKVGTRLTHGRPSHGNAVTPLFGGNDTYDAMGLAIDAAKHHIHAQYYLIRNDATGAWFKEKLIAAAQRGVEVRLLCDGYGCFTLPRSYTRALQKAGVRVASFLPMRSVLLQPMNLRNHRKIVVIDGETAFTGGLNIGDEYRGQMKGVGAWRDIHISIRGPAARDLQRVFMQDWTFASGELLDAGKYFPENPAQPGVATIAIVPSGPDTRNEAIQRIFFGAIAGARDHVHMTTPYFVPDQAITVAMELAAMRGVNVSLVLPSHSNHAVTFHAGRSFYDPLLEAGVRLYEFTPGIVHAKTMMVNGAVSLVGSANMDLRSFRLNFEVHALVHDASLATKLESGFAEDLRASKLVNLVEWRARPAVARVYEGASRLVSPLL